MINYSTSPIAALVGPPPGGGPINPGFIPGTQSLNTRDVLSGFIGKGFTDLKSEDARNAYAYLRGSLGQATASRLMNHAIIFNQRSDMQGVDPAKKIQTYYDMGSRDPELNNIITRAGKVSYGPIEGMNTSPDRNLMDITNRDVVKAKPGQKVGLTTPLAAGADLLQKRADNVRNK